MSPVLCAACVAWLLLPGLPAMASVASPSRRPGPGMRPWEDLLLQLAARLAARGYSTMALVCLESRAPCSATPLLRGLGAAAHMAAMTLQPAEPAADSLATSSPAASLDVPRPSVPLNGKTAYVMTRVDSDSCQLVEKFTGDSTRAAVVLMSIGTEGFNVSIAQEAFRTCWAHRFLNVIAIFGNHAASQALPPSLPQLADDAEAVSASIYTYEPFTPGACNFPTPRLVRTWSHGSILGTVEEIGLSGKVDNLNGCALRVSTLPMRPWTSIEWDEQQSRFTLGGSLLPLLQAFSSRMNFTANISLPLTSKTLGTADTCPACGGVYGELFHNRSDLAVLMTYKRSVPTPHHVQILTCETSCSTWCLPTGYRSRSMAHLLLAEFSPRLWLALLLLFGLAVGFFWLLSRCGCRLSAGRVALLTLRALLGGPVTLRPTCSDAMRVFFLGWAFFSVIMGTLYGAVLRSFVVAERDATVFRAIEDIVDAGIPFYLPAERMHFFHDPPLSDAGSEGPVMRRALPFSWEESYSLLHNLTLARNFSVFLERDTCLSMARVHTPARSPAVFHVLRGHCGPLLRRTVSYVIVLRRSPLLHRLQPLMARLDEAGITAYWTRSPEPPPSWGQHRAASPLRMSQVLPFFILLVAGLVAAILAFVLELLAHRLLGSARCLKNMLLGAVRK